MFYKFGCYNSLFSYNVYDVVKLAFYFVLLTLIEFPEFIREIQFSYIAVFFHYAKVTNKIQNGKYLVAFCTKIKGEAVCSASPFRYAFTRFSLDYLLMNFLPFLIIRPLKLLLTRCPAMLYAGALTFSALALMSLMPSVLPRLKATLWYATALFSPIP